MSRFGLGIVLLAVWLLLWGSASPANLLSGVAVIVGLYVVFPSSRPLAPTIRFRPIALARLLAHFLASIVGSNIMLSRTILSRHARVHSGVVRVQMHCDDLTLLTMVINITALTPGSMAVELDLDQVRPVIWVHVLTSGDPTDIGRNVLVLEELCVRALGSAEQIGRLGAHTPSSLTGLPEPGLPEFGHSDPDRREQDPT